jgi:spermidine synthase
MATPPSPAMPGTRFWKGFGIVFLCFFLSGATGLVYQVLWLRMLGLVFGHTVYAITTVLAAFMAGLALGSFVFARLSTRIRDLIRAYGWIEIAIGVYCALLPLLLKGAAWIYLGLHGALGLSYDTFGFVQFVLVALLLVVPTSLMGGTLPVLSQALVTQEAELGRKVGALYAVNTFGAVVGVMLAGYVLLPALGNHLTIAIAALANVGVGLLAIAWSRRRRPAEAPPAEAAAARAAKPGKDRAAGPAPEGATWGLGERLTVIGLGVSGAVSIVYEVGWTRSLALVIGSSTYAFTSMLVAFLVGIAGGSALYSWLLGVRRASPATFGAIQVAIGVSVAITVLVFERIPELFLVAFRWTDSATGVQVVQLVVSSATLLVSTLLIGATFPCAVAVAARSAARVGQDVGQIYSINTVGAIAGAGLAGFVLIPALGVQGSLKVGIAVNLLLGAALLAVSARLAPAWRWGGAGGALALAVLTLLIPRWDYRVMTSGPAVYAKGYAGASAKKSLSELLRGQDILFYRDGISGTVSVNREGQHVFLRVNGKMDAGTAIDMGTQLMSGHLPMLFHPHPRSVLVIGMGSGITAGAVARHPVERLEIVEIEPAVVEATRFFAREHGNVLADPRVKVVIADGRNYLLTTRQRYDVIISEPSNPWMAGLASLFSVEFYAMARERLRPGGLMLQWIQGYNIPPEDLRMVINSFRSSFPAVSIWNTIPGDFLLIGRREAVPLDLHALKARYEGNPGVWGDFDRFRVGGWPGVLGYFMLGEEDTPKLLEGAGLNTDDRLSLEFTAPRGLYRDTTMGNWEMIRRSRTAALPQVTPESRPELELPDVRYWIGMGYLGRQIYRDAFPFFQQVLAADPGHTGAMLALSEVYLGVGRPAESFRLARAVIDREPLNGTAFFVAGVSSELLNSRNDAIALLQRAVALQPQNEYFQSILRRVAAGMGVR